MQIHQQLFSQFPLPYQQIMQFLSIFGGESRLLLCLYRRCYDLYFISLGILFFELAHLVLFFDLVKCVDRLLHAYLELFPHRCLQVIAENASNILRTLQL